MASMHLHQGVRKNSGKTLGSQRRKDERYAIEDGLEELNLEQQEKAMTAPEVPEEEQCAA